MSNMKCQHEWEYFDEYDFPNGYEYEQVNIPHKRCKKCGREYELFDGYGEYAKRWRKVEYWSPELHRLEQELIRTHKALGVAVDALKEISLLYSEKRNSPESVWAITAIDMAEYADNAIDKITALEQKDK